MSVRRSNIAGWGLFAGTKIKCGEFVAEYKGDVSSMCAEYKYNITC